MPEATRCDVADLHYCPLLVADRLQSSQLGSCREQDGRGRGQERPTSGPNQNDGIHLFDGPFHHVLLQQVQGEKL